ncbi:MAG: hypothetical protein AB7T07_07335 [Steroidobacteraceae bacterium]
MKIHYALASLLLLQAATTSSVLAAEGFQISPRVGKSTLHLDADVVATHEAVDKDTLLTGVTLGYVTPIGLMAEGGYSKQGNWDVFGWEDKYRLSEYTLAVGFQIDTPRGFRIVPKVGRERWDLYSKEGSLNHSGPENTHTIRSYDNFWELTLQKKIGESAALGITYKDNPYDFGNVRSIAFTASFGL